MLVRSGFAPADAAIAGVVLNVGSVLGALLITFVTKRFGTWLPVVAAFVLGTVLLLVLSVRIGEREGLWALVFLTG